MFDWLSSYIDHTNTLGVYGDFDSAVADKMYNLPNLGNTATVTDKGWANAGLAYNYASAYSYVYFITNYLVMIVNYETPAATKLKEGVRTNHLGHEFRVKNSDPTTTEAQ